MSTSPDPAPYIKAATALLKQIVADGEARLSAQLTAGLAADQRALILAGFLVPTITALVGASVALFLQAQPQYFLAWLSIMGAGGLFVSLSLVAYTARPVDWSFPGIMPGAWVRDIADEKPEHESWAELAADADRRARENAAVLARNGKFVRAALGIAATTLALGGGAVMWFFTCGH